MGELTMKEEQFWNDIYTRLRLEGLAEIDGAIDWIEPKKYYMAASPSYIVGRMGFIGDHHNKERQFTLYLDRTYDTFQEIDWHLSLPSPGAGWCAVVDDGITINPAFGEDHLTR